MASRVNVKAQALRYELFSASIIWSFEKKPAKNGMPVRAMDPRVTHEDVSGAR